MNLFKRILPKPFKKRLKKVFDSLAKKMGYTKMQIVNRKEGKNALIEILFNNLKAMEFIPKHIVDVGANHGTWTREALLYFPDAYYTLLEPQEWLKPSFQDLLDVNSKIDYHAVGAGAETGSFLFTLVNRDDSCSFRYTKEEAEKEDFKQIEIPVITLNELVESKPDLPIPDLVKIDAEGMDIEVLKGASDLFGKTEVFLVEASVNSRLYDNTVLEMINFMDQKGYALFEITDLNRPFSPNILWLVELAFVKKNGVLHKYKLNYKI